MSGLDLAALHGSSDGGFARSRPALLVESIVRGTVGGRDRYYTNRLAAD